jgi:hypothetical protein
VSDTIQNSRSSLEKVEQIGLLAVHGAWDHITHESADIAIKATEGLVIGAALATARSGTLDDNHWASFDPETMADYDAIFSQDIPLFLNIWSKTPGKG